VTDKECSFRKVTPSVIRSLWGMTLEKKTKREISEAIGISCDLIKRIRSGTYPCLDAASHWEWQETFGSIKAETGGDHPAGLDLNDLPATVVPAAPSKPTTGLSSGPSQNKLAPTSLHLAEAAPEVPVNQTETTGVDPMLLVNAGLSPETRKHFKLARNPFVDDVQSPDDVYQTPSVRYVRAALTDAARHHGFVAVVGESGAGKSTLAEDLQERIRADGNDILIIKPYVLAMEGSDDRGKTLKSSQIAEAIAVALDPHVRLRISSEARFRQVHEMLTASRRSGRRHLLVIEEAHCLPLATLKHLKRFTELKDGMQRLLGVALIGQPELRDRLGSQNAEVREVAQRCEIVELEPLDGELEGYLQHKFARFDLKLSDVFTADAFDAMRARLIYRPRGGRPGDARSLCFPLVVNNLVCRAMNAAAAAHWPQVDAQVIGGC
jgi:type II secretory pathway predicted ATPase ExeA